MPEKTRAFIRGGAFIVNEVRIEKLVYGGDGLARIDGRVILTPFVLPGELARVEAGDDVRAELIEVLEAAPERVAPPCPIFGRCGGCNYQHAPYEYQVARKIEILREQLRRVGKIEFAGEIAAVTGEPWAYRNRVQVHVENGKLGYRAARSHALVPLTGECPISSPRINASLAMLRERLQDSRFPKFVRSLELFTNESDVQINVLESAQPVARRFFEWMSAVDTIDYATTLGSFRVSPHSFFQVNRFLIEPLVETALHDASGASAIDLYAGVGLFAVPLAKRFESVKAVEAGTSAVRDLQLNAERAGVRVDVDQSRVEEFVARLEETPEFVLADPPRAGLGKIVTTHLLRLAPRRIVIVSCDPATLARDLAALLVKYRIERVALVDLFPQTYHMETVVDLRLIE